MTNLSPYYKEFPPPDCLASIIGTFWCFATHDVTAHSQDSIQHRVLPDGCMDLIFQCQRSPNGKIYNPQLTIYGSTDRFSLVDIKPATEFVGVRFHPGMAGLLLKLKPLNLFQQEARAQDCSPEFVKVFDQLCECSSIKQALNTLQISLLALQKTDCHDISLSAREALRLITTTNGRMPVSQMAATIGVSERTLRRGVTAAVGLCPKVLARILRFQNAVACLRALEAADLCHLALECGYADQAHMAREFQQLSGLTPTTFMS